MTESRDAQLQRVLGDYGPALARLARAYTHSAADADDLVQEIAFALWRALPSFRGECSERTFVYRVAHNRASTWRRSTRRYAGGADLDEMVEDPAPRADELTSSADRAERLRRAVASLPEGQRQVVLLRLEGLSDAEVADVVGISEGNVAVRLTRTRKLLRTMLGADADD